MELSFHWITCKKIKPYKKILTKVEKVIKVTGFYIFCLVEDYVYIQIIIKNYKM